MDPKGKSLKNKKKNRIGKPPAVLYSCAFCVMSLIYRLRYRVTVDRQALRGLKGPAVVLAPHVSGKDHVLTGIALFPNRPTYVLSEHFMARPFLRRVLKMMHAIPKKMFCPDTRSVLNMIRAVREGNVLVLFPEGRLTWYGRSLEITEGTAELVRQLGVNVYSVISDGAGMTFPKWAKFPRRGRIHIRTVKLFDGAELKSMTVPQVDAAIRTALTHDEERAMPGVPFRARDLTAGADGILWKCPRCGGTHTLECGNSRIRCTSCGLACTMDEYGRLEGDVSEYGIRTVGEWYEYNAAGLDISVPLEYDCAVGTTDGDGYMRRDTGRGRIRLDRENLTFSGTVSGEQADFSLPTEKIKAFPITVGDHVDVYVQNKLWYLTPLPDPRDSILLVAFMDKVTRERGQARQNTEA